MPALAEHTRRSLWVFSNRDAVRAEAHVACTSPCSLSLEKVSTMVSLLTVAPQLTMGMDVSIPTKGHRQAPPPWGQGAATKEEASAWWAAVRGASTKRWRGAALIATCDFVKEAHPMRPMLIFFKNYTV